MAKTRAQKEQSLKAIGDIVKNAETLAFVGFKGFGVGPTTDMRKALGGAGVEYQVVKKTLLRKALNDAGVPGETPAFSSEVAIAYLPKGEGTDATAPARGVWEFAKKYEGALSLLGGIFEGRFVSAAGITEIASIPPLQTLRGMFVNVINSPIQRMAIVLSEVLKVKN